MLTALSQRTLQVWVDICVQLLLEKGVPDRGFTERFQNRLQKLSINLLDFSCRPIEIVMHLTKYERPISLSIQAAIST